MKRLQVLILSIVSMCLAGTTFGQPEQVWFEKYGIPTLSVQEECFNGVLITNANHEIFTILVGRRHDLNASTYHGYYVVLDEDGDQQNQVDELVTPDIGVLLTVKEYWGIAEPGYVLGGNATIGNDRRLWVQKYDDDHSLDWTYIGPPQTNREFIRMDLFHDLSNGNIEVMGHRVSGATSSTMMSADGIALFGTHDFIISEFTANRIRWAINTLHASSDWLLAGHTPPPYQNGPIYLRTLLAQRNDGAYPRWTYEYNIANSFASDAVLNTASDIDASYSLVGGSQGDLMITHLDSEGGVENPTADIWIYDGEAEPFNQTAVLTTGNVVWTENDIIYSEGFVATAVRQPSGANKLIILNHDGEIAYNILIQEPDTDLLPKFIAFSSLEPTVEVYVGGYLKDSNGWDFWMTRIYLGSTENVWNELFFASDSLDSPCGLVARRHFIDNIPQNAVRLWWRPVEHADEYYIYASDDSETDFEDWDLIGTATDTTWIDWDWDPEDVCQINDKNRFYVVTAVNWTSEFESGYSNMVGAYEFVAPGYTELVGVASPFGLPFKFWHLDENGVPIYQGNEQGELYESFEPSEIIGPQINPGGPVNSDKIVRQGGSQAYINLGGVWIDPLETSLNWSSRMIPGKAYWLLNKSGEHLRIILAGQVDNMGFYDPIFVQAPTSTPSYATAISFRDSRFLLPSELYLLDVCNAFLGGDNTITSDKLVEQGHTGTQWNYVASIPGINRITCEGEGNWTPAVTTVVPGRAYFIINKHLGHSWEYVYPWLTIPICEVEEEE